MAILSIWTMAQGENIIAIKRIQLKGMQKQDYVEFISIQPFLIFSFSPHFLQMKKCKNANSLGPIS